MRSRLGSALFDWRFWVAAVALVTIEQITRHESQLAQLESTATALLAALIVVVLVEWILDRTNR